MSTSRTILQVVPELHEGGVERSAIEMALYTQQQGWTPIVASSGGTMSDILVKHGILHITLPLHHKNPFSILYNAWKLHRLIHKHGVQLAQARSRAPAWATWLACKISHVAYLPTFQGIHGTKGFGKIAYNSSMVRAPYILANSHYTKTHISTTYHIAPERIFVAQRGFDPTRLPETLSKVAARRETLDLLKLNADAKLILLVGRLTPWKGQETALKALQKVHKDHPQAHLIFAGGTGKGKKAAYKEKLEHFVKTYNLEKVVHFVGSQTELAPWYAAADIALSCSTKPEAFGRVAVEAQAMSTPIIATNHGGHLETIKDGETGYLIPPNNPQALAEKLSDCLTNAKKLDTLGQQAKHWARTHFTTEMTCKAEFSAYKHVLNTFYNKKKT